ncbi:MULTISPECIES: DUF6455 family protein [unclassified Ruegeria]|uniref:DUF6455 family protein n=1 Tax=unclassified Ruegeria TaxID=2625375 RepID=UPI0014915E23|nr:MULTISPECIES: DUF6455 family protein [unclassified Ruegeria]NOC43795.1 hypothetical protein [Ruegeria sp. HKCCD7559]NOD84131.1 hypothetical protein [Ruegeria sp. HKCCD6119]
MTHLGEIMTHLRLVLRMGQTTGTDLAAAYRKGHLKQQEWAEIVQQCRGCSWARDCPEWLERREQVEQAPTTCPNRKYFTALKTKQVENA